MEYVGAILIGVACGIVAGIPTSALIIMALARRKMVVLQLWGEHDGPRPLVS